jgi:autotransporter-associated beta strand protein
MSRQTDDSRKPYPQLPFSLVGREHIPYVPAGLTTIEERIMTAANRHLDPAHCHDTRRLRGHSVAASLTASLAVALAILCGSERALAANGSWIANGNGSWNTASNWTPAAVPGTAAGDVVGLVNNITTSATVTINTNVTLGTLNIGDTDASNSFTLATTTGGTLTFNNSGSGASISQVATSAANTISAPFTLADNLTITNRSPNFLTISGVISETGGARSLTKAGLGLVALTGSSTYTGATTITGGTLVIGDNATAGAINPASALSIGNGSLFIQRTDAVSQAFASTTLTGGAAYVAALGNPASEGVNAGTRTTMNFGAITRSRGATLTIQSSGTFITSSANTNGILSGGITFGGDTSLGWQTRIPGFAPTTWAVANGASPITGLATFVLSSTASTVASRYASANVDVNASATPSAAIAPNSLRFNTANPITLTLVNSNTIASGGILVTNNVSGSTNLITGGTIAGSSGGDLVVTQANWKRSFEIASAIADNTSATGLTKSGFGGLVLSGRGLYTGPTAINNGVLTFAAPSSLYDGNSANWTAANISAASGATFAVRVGGASGFSGANVTTLLTNLGGLGGSVTTGGLLAGSAIGFDTTNTGSTFTVANTIIDSTGSGGGTIGVVKLGSGTLSLTGVTSSTANNYTGRTVIDQGTLVLPDGASLAGAVGFGANAGGTLRTLDLTNSSVTFGGLTAQNGLSTANSITIGNGRTLTTNGDVVIGPQLPGENVGLTVSGTGGAWNVSRSGGTFQVGWQGSTYTNSQDPGQSTLDASGLGTFSVNVGTTGVIRVGSTEGFGFNGSGRANTFFLAPTSTITAGTLPIGDGSGATGTSSLILGNGVQTINVNAIQIGGQNRSSGVLQFNANTPNGTVRIRGADGTSAVRVTMVGNPGTGAVQSPNVFDVTGHSADLLFSTIDMINVSGPGSNYSAAFNFDTGTLQSGTFRIGTRTGGANAAVPTATVTIGSGTGNFTNTASLGVVQMAQMAGTGGGITGSLTVAGNATTVNVASLVLAGASAAGGTSTGSLTINGGTVTLAGDITISSTVGTVNSTLTLNGGTLDMGGKNIGGSNRIAALNFQSGGLRNVNQINGGADLVKTTSGTLALSGTNTFTGATTITAGVLSFGGASALQGTSGVTIAGGAGLTYTGGAATFGKNITVTAGSGTGTIRNPGGGLLTLSGNLSKDNSVLRLTGGSFNVTGTISGATVGASDLLVDGTSSVTLSAANTYNGPTFVIESSTLAYGITNAIPSNSVVNLGNATSQGTLAMSGYTGAIGGLAFGSAGGTLRLAATSTSAPVLTAATGTMTLTNGTLDLAGSGSTAGLYRVLSAQSISGSFASITGTSAAYQVISSATSIDYQQRAVLGAVTVTNPAVSIITGGSAAFTYTVANSALSGGANLGFSSGSLSASLAGTSSGTAAAGGPSGAISGLVFTGTSVGATQQGTFTVNAPTAFGVTSATGTVSVNVLDHALPGFLASGITDAYAQDALTINFGSIDESSGTQNFTYSLLNLASQTYGAGQTAGLDFTGVTLDGGGFASGLSTFNNLAAGGTSSLFTFSFTPSGQGAFSKQFTLSFFDNQNLSGASARRNLTINANVVVVPEPGALALAAVGISLVGWLARRRR